MSAENMARTWQDRILTTKRLRQLLRKRWTPLVPEQLARHLSHAIPEIYSPDALEISAMLNEMVDSVRAELDSAGILPDFRFFEEKSLPANCSIQRLNARERNLTADFAALLTWASEAHSLVANSPNRENKEHGYYRQKAIELAREAIGWGETANDISQLGICLLHFGDIVHQLEADLREAERIFRAGIDLMSQTEPIQQKEILLLLFAELGQVLIEQGESDDALEVASNAEKLITPGADIQERRTRIRFLIIRSTVAIKRNDLSSALALGQQALQWSDPEYDPVQHSALLQDMALTYRRMEHPEGSLELLLNAIATLEAYSIASIGAWVYISTAGIYHVLREIGKAHEILDRALTILGIDGNELPENPDRILLLIHGSRSDLFLAEAEYEKAQRLLDWTIEKSHAIEFYSTEVAACAMAAAACGRQDRYKEACQYLEQAINVSDQSDQVNRIRLHIQLAKWKLLSGNIDEAEQLLAIAEPETRGEDSQRVRYLRQLAQLFEHKGELAKTLECEREAARIEVDLLETNRERSIRYARIIAENGVLEQAVEHEKERRQRLEHNLADAVVKLGEKEQIIEDIRQKLKGELTKKKQVGEVASAVTSNATLRALLSITEKGVDQSESPLAYMGSAGEEFVRQLRIKYPNLTAKQERLCMLIHAGLNSKEICTLLEIKSEGLKSHRKRLRKVLNLNEGDSLEKAIAEVMVNE